MKKIQKIKVTRNIIKASRLLIDEVNFGEFVIRSCHTPIAFALDKNTGYHGWTISRNGKEALLFKEDGTIRVSLPRSAQRFLKRFESSNTVRLEPFNFNVSI